MRTNGADVLDRVSQDLRYAWRGIRRSRGAAAAIALTLALAVGANAAVFSIVDPLLFRPPPGVSAPSQLRHLYANHPNALRAKNGQAIGDRFSYPELLSIRQALVGTALVAADIRHDSIAIRVGSDSVFANADYATGNFLSVVGAPLLRGRLLVDQDDDLNSPATAAVVSEAFARRSLGGADAAIGRSVVADKVIYTIVGVTKGDFAGIDISATDLWLPLSTRPRFGGFQPDRPWYADFARYLPIVARLTAPIDDRSLEARATIGYLRGYSSTDKREEGRRIVAGPLIDARGPAPKGQEVSIATALAVVAVILLLIACANVANLLLARAMLRRREIAVRLALGVSRSRLASQLFIESLMLAVFAGVAALLGASWAGGALRGAILPRVHWVAPPVGLRVIIFGVTLTLVAALLSAVFPAILTSRADLSESLKTGNSGGSPRSRTRTALLIVQAALSVMLVVGAALFSRSLRNVRAVDLGVDADHLIMAPTTFLDRKRHPELSVLPSVAERVRAIPGVDGVAYGTGGPFSSYMGGVQLSALGADAPLTSEGRGASYNGVSTNYFAVTGTRIIAGRGFLPSDQPNAAPVMVVGRTLAESLWPGTNPIGKCLIPDARTNPCYTIVGIAEDVHSFRIVEDKTLGFYIPVGQDGRSPTTLIVHVRSGDPHAVAALVRRQLVQTFPNASVNARVVADALVREVRPWRIAAEMFTALSLLALVVATVGIYSVVAFQARQRTREMAVRAALGARTSDLVRLVLGGGLVSTAIGVALGIAGALAGGRFVASLLYGITPRDPIALIVASVVALVAGALAGFGPAWRAGTLDPALVLRDE